MSEPYLGEIKMFAGSFAPRGYALCNGQLLAIAQHDALFSLLGTIYGGDGRSTFALPDMRGRLPVGAPAQGPGLTPRRQGERGGAETHTLTPNEMPQHAHTLRGATAPAADRTPNGRQLAEPESDAYAAAGATTIASTSTGGGQAHENQPPQLTINYIIATTGVFPARN